VHYELDSEAPMTTSKSIGKAIKKGMRCVNYRHKETGSLKEIELGLTEQQIRTRLKGATQASGRKVCPMTARAYPVTTHDYLVSTHDYLVTTRDYSDYLVTTL
jgi:hypothetical protein